MLSLDGLADLISASGARALHGERDPGVAAAAMTRAGLRPTTITPVDAPEGLHASLDVISSDQPTRFARLSYGSAAEVSAATPEHDAFLFVLALSGTAGFRYGGADVIVAPGRSGFVVPYREFDALVDADYDQIVVTMPRERVETIAAGLLDSTDVGPVEFDYAVDDVRQGADVLHLIAAAARMSASTRPQLQHRIGDVLIEAALLSMPSFRGRMERPRAAHSRAVGAAMEYMRANLGDPLTLTEISAQALVSPRALQLAFKKEIGQTPMQWLRDRRLDTAYALLRSAGSAHLRITDIAHRSGFVHLGDFAQRFRGRFGTTPSELRARSRTSSVRESDIDSSRN